MKLDKKLKKLSCEQVYSLWSSEPEVLQIFDLRSSSEYKAAHIPGAIHLQESDLQKKLQNLGDRLAVLIVSDELEKQLVDSLGEYDNYVFLNQCHRWMELNQPLAGSGTQNSSLQFKKILLKNKGESMHNDILFYQLFEPVTSTYTYIIADKKTKEAAIIDPVLETVERDLKLVEELNLNLRYVLDTHIHADHITGAAEIRKRVGAKTAVSVEAHSSAFDIPLEDGQELSLGDKKIKVIATPGHTDTCLTYAFEGMIFTGDALLIRTCGRTDFQAGNPDVLFHSVREKLFKLPDETVVFPGHDYRGYTSSTIGAERLYNARLKESYSLDDFKKIMSELKLANPKKIHEAVPANLAGGVPQDRRALHPQIVDNIPEINVENLHAHMDKVVQLGVKMVDVRRPEEFNNELGHIKGAELVTLGPELTKYLEAGDRNQEIVFVCRSGARSGNATIEAMNLGYKFAMNMVGGMIRWNENKFAVERSDY